MKFLLIALALFAPLSAHAQEPRPLPVPPVRAPSSPAARNDAVAAEMQKLGVASQPMGRLEQRTNDLFQEALRRAREVLAMPPDSRAPAAAELWAASWSPRFETEVAAIRAEAANTPTPDLSRFPLVSAMIARNPGGIEAARKAFAMRRDNVLGLLDTLESMSATEIKAAGGDPAALKRLPAAPSQAMVSGLRGEIANWDLAARLEPPDSALAPLMLAMTASDRGVLEVNQLIVGLITGDDIDERASGRRLLQWSLEGRRHIAEVPRRIDVAENRVRGQGAAAANLAKLHAIGALMHESATNEGLILDQLEIIGKRLTSGEETRVALRDSKVDQLIQHRVELNRQRAALMAN